MNKQEHLVFTQSYKCCSVPVSFPAASPDTPIPSPPQGPAPEMYKHFPQPVCPPASPSPSAQTDPWLFPALCQRIWQQISFLAPCSLSRHGMKIMTEISVQCQQLDFPTPWLLELLIQYPNQLCAPPFGLYFLTVAKLTKEKYNFYAVFFRYKPVCACLRVCLCLFAYFLAPECLAAQALGILIRRRSQILVLILAQNCICLKTRSDHVLPTVITPQQEWYVCFHCSHWYERGIVFKLRWWHSSNFIIHLNLQTWQQDPSTKGMFSVFLSITLESYFSEI